MQGSRGGSRDTNNRMCAGAVDRVMLIPQSRHYRKHAMCAGLLDPANIQMEMETFAGSICYKCLVN